VSMNMSQPSPDHTHTHGHTNHTHTQAEALASQCEVGGEVQVRLGALSSRRAALDKQLQAAHNGVAAVEAQVRTCAHAVCGCVSMCGCFYPTPKPPYESNPELCASCYPWLDL
jgi:hypothetical protein